MVLRGKCNGAKHVTEAADLLTSSDVCQVVGEHSTRLRSVTERTRGGRGRAYADMSSDKKGEKPFRRKSKVSWVKLIFPGLVGP